MGHPGGSLAITILLLTTLFRADSHHGNTCSASSGRCRHSGTVAHCAPDAHPLSIGLHIFSRLGRAWALRCLSDSSASSSRRSAHRRAYDKLQLARVLRHRGRRSTRVRDVFLFTRSGRQATGNAPQYELHIDAMWLLQTGYPDHHGTRGISEGWWDSGEQRIRRATTPACAMLSRNGARPIHRWHEGLLDRSP